MWDPNPKQRAMMRAKEIAKRKRTFFYLFFCQFRGKHLRCIAGKLFGNWCTKRHRTDALFRSVLFAQFRALSSSLDWTGSLLSEHFQRLAWRFFACTSSPSPPSYAAAISGDNNPEIHSVQIKDVYGAQCWQIWLKWKVDKKRDFAFVITSCEN